MREFIIGAAVLLTVVSTSRVVAQQTNDPPVAERLLKDLWEKEAGNRDAAAQLWSADDTARKDPDATLAYIYNRMQHARTREALDAAKELNDLDPRDIDGRLVRIWLETTTDQFERSLVQMGSLKRELERQKDLPADLRTSALRKLGRWIGYLEGPVKERINVDTLEQTIATISNNLLPAEQTVFDDARQQTINRFLQQSATNTQTINSEKDRLQREIEEETRNLEQAKQDYDLRISQLVPQLDALREQANQQIAVAQQQAEPLQREAASIDAAIADTQYDLNRLYWDLARYNDLAPRHPNTAFIWRAIRNRQFDLNNLYSRADSVAIQLADSVARLRQIELDYDRRMDAVNDEINQIGRAKRKSQKRLNKLAKGPVVASGKMQAMDNRTASILTYDQFPLELKRQQLLDRLR